MPEEIAGHFRGRGRRFAIVASRFNDLVVDRLVAAAVDTLRRHEVADADIRIVRVPGAWEIPTAAAALVDRSGGCDALIALGAVIRGETPHFDHVAARVAGGLGALADRSATPIIFGVLTTNDLAQALERAGGKAGNKGAEAALAALEMVDVLATLRGAKPQT